MLAPASRRGIARLRALVRELGVERVVVGLPLSLSGDDSAQTAETRAFAATLASQLSVPVELYDERFTTRIAQRTGGAADEDSRAAAHLLEGWLAAGPPGPGGPRSAVADSGERSEAEREAARLERERRRATRRQQPEPDVAGPAPAASPDTDALEFEQEWDDSGRAIPSAASTTTSTPNEPDRRTTSSTT